LHKQENECNEGYEYATQKHTQVSKSELPEIRDQLNAHAVYIELRMCVHRIGRKSQHNSIYNRSAVNRNASNKHTQMATTLQLNIPARSEHE
jgi:hypothetical protein